MYPSRINADFSDAVYVPTDTREVEGYFVFREDTYIAYSDDLEYGDSSMDFDGNEYWDLKNSKGRKIAPGLYIYIVQADNGATITSKFAIVR